MKKKNYQNYLSQSVSIKCYVSHSREEKPRKKSLNLRLFKLVTNFYKNFFECNKC